MSPIFFPNAPVSGFDCPGDAGCPDCGKVVTRDTEGYFIVDERGRYWCVEHAVRALGNIRRREDTRPNIDLYPWRFSG